jgi:hypothetical protein
LEDAVVRPATIEARAYIPEPRVVVTRLVQGFAEATLTPEDLQKLAEIFQEAEEEGLQPEQVESRIRDSTPFAWLLALLPQNRSERIAYLAILVEIIGIIVAVIVGRQPGPQPSQPPRPTITPQQVEEIVERVVERIEQNPPTPPSSSPAPASRKELQEKESKSKKETSRKQQ